MPVVVSLFDPTLNTSRLVDLANLTPDRALVRSALWGISRMPRYGGHTRGTHVYTVAQHSLILSYIVDMVSPRTWVASYHALAALAHDLPEGLALMDMPRPVKQAMGPGYAELEAVAWRAVADSCGLPHALSGVVKVWDKRLCRTEFPSLVAGGAPELLPIEPLTGERARFYWLARWRACAMALHDRQPPPVWRGTISNIMRTGAELRGRWTVDAITVAPSAAPDWIGSVPFGF